MTDRVPVTPSFDFDVATNVRDGVVWLRIFTGRHLMLQGAIRDGTADALRRLADECDRVVPPSPGSPMDDLFSGKVEDG